MRTVRNNKIDYDLIIIGGGVTGSVLAVLLEQTNLKIALVEANRFDPEKNDPRVFAITLSSEQIFRSAGIWEELQSQPMGHFREINVWDANGSGNIHFDSKTICEPTLGYIIENQKIQSALKNKIDPLENIDWHCPEKIDQLTTHSDHVSVLLESGKKITSKLIVGADGANSRVRELAEIKNEIYDYQQTAIVCSVKTQVVHNDIARQRFLSSGPLAFLPLSDPHMSSIVWSTTPNQAQALLKSNEEIFHQELEQAFDSKLGSILESSHRFSFPLTRAHAKNYVTERIALIGDAAHRVHPLAGQGANLGILDATTLAEILIQHSEHDIGRKSILRKYERWRKGENLSVIATMDGFKYLFGSTLEPVQWIRNTGLDITNSSTFAKNLIMRKVIGLEGDLPKIALTNDIS